LLLLVVLFPIAVYLALLGWVNRRSRGLLLSGPWDFAGILLAASGFLLLGGPDLLGSLTQTNVWRRVWARGQDGNDRPNEDRLAAGRVAVFAGYFVIVVAGSAGLLWRRRRLTVLYNVDPALVETVLGQTFERLRLSFVQTGNVLLIEPAPVKPDETATASPPPPGPVLLDKVTTLEVEASAAMCHVSLWWDPPDSLLRREVEQQLRLALAQHDAPENAAGDWFLLISSTLFFLLVIGAGALLLKRFLG
jgi:hypothetical protein